MLRVGIAGIGFMGMIHYLAYRKVRGAKVTALCSRDPKKLDGDWRGIQGNFGPPGSQMNLGPVKKYTALAEMLADREIDLIDVCLPPNQHAAASIAAVKAGKHVLCEKPIALDMGEAWRMVADAAAARRQLLIAHVLPFTAEYAFALELARSGKYGRFLGGHFKRVIAEPSWLPDFFNPKIVGGPMVDLHVHDAHFIRLLAGMPASVYTSGRLRGEVAESFTSHFRFPDPTVMVSAASGVIHQQGRSFTHAYEIQFERATLLYDFAVLGGEPVLSTPVTVLTADGKLTRPKLKAADPVEAFVKELAEAARSITGGEPSSLLDGQLACDALRMCVCQTKSLLSGKPVKVG